MNHIPTSIKSSYPIKLNQDHPEFNEALDFFLKKQCVFIDRNAITHVEVQQGLMIVFAGNWQIMHFGATYKD